MEAKVIKKYDNKSHPWLIKKAQEMTNLSIRLRDSYPQHADYKKRYFTCISCGFTKSTQYKDHKGKTRTIMQAGHLHSAGKFSVLRFNLDNVNGECKYCNYYSKDHLRQYETNLIKKIGCEKTNKLKFLADQSKGKLHKHDRFTLIDIIENRKKDIKGLT